MSKVQCPILDDCYKIIMLCDKDILRSQFVELAESICTHCQQADKEQPPEE